MRVTALQYILQGETRRWCWYTDDVFAVLEALDRSPTFSGHIAAKKVVEKYWERKLLNLKSPSHLKRLFWIAKHSLKSDPHSIISWCDAEDEENEMNPKSWESNIYNERKSI